MTSVKEVEFDSVEVAVSHKRDVDLQEDGCIARIEITLRHGTGCTLSGRAESSFGEQGGLKVQELSFLVDSQCPGFSDAIEGLYEDTGELLVAEITIEDLYLGVDNVPEWCFQSTIALQLKGTMFSLATGTQIEILPTSISVTGNFLSIGDESILCPCTPDCEGTDCGADGCGGLCGVCGPGFGCDQGSCIDGSCVPQCAGKDCGPDGCDGSCGNCACGETCDIGTCVFDACDGMVCGDDGCGGSCGDCGELANCHDGQCVLICPNDTCDDTETCCNCPEDCGPCCGNGLCDCDETSVTCPDDCCECGDLICDVYCAEWTASCEVDCCICGDGKCSISPCGENALSCTDDCWSFVCGNGTCDPGESPVNCPWDCGNTACGNGECEPGESPVTCLYDCTPFACGNHVCEEGEDPDVCPMDCSPKCGDCICDPGEDWIDCPEDCGWCGDAHCGPNCGEGFMTCPEDCCTDGNPCTEDVFAVVNDEVQCSFQPLTGIFCDVACQGSGICHVGVCVCSSQ